MPKRILIIEDNDEIREGTAELLMLDGFVVLTADCGIDAIELLKSQSADLIICDIVMAGMDGYEVLASIKNNPETSNIPFIFSSAKSEKIDIQKARNLGIKNYLIKPFDGLELLNHVNNCLCLA